jgi:hypothetical protein
LKRWKISGIIIRHLTKGRNVLTIKHFAWIKYTQCLYWQTSICPILVSYLKTGTVYRGIERLMQIFFVCFVSQSIRCLSSHIDVTHQMPNFGGVVLISCSLIVAEQNYKFKLRWYFFMSRMTCDEKAFKTKILLAYMFQNYFASFSFIL